MFGNKISFSCQSNLPFCVDDEKEMGPLQDPVTWYIIIYTGEQVAQWDFQNKGRSRWTGTSCIVLEVPLRNLLTSIYNFVPCDWVVQRAHSSENLPWPATGIPRNLQMDKQQIGEPTFNQWNQSINQSFSQSINQSISQSSQSFHYIKISEPHLEPLENTEF